MRKLVLSLVLIALAQMIHAFEAEDHATFGNAGAEEKLRIISTADIGFFKPMIQSFLATRPDVSVDYTVASSTELMHAIYDEDQRFDLAISSAMDLQTKLANDGKAQRHFPATTQTLPDWAVWNDMVFAFTQEPAAIVISNAAFADLPIPRSRHELINILRQKQDIFRGRVGTYDVRQSGLGYLFATQDTRASETYWRLAEVMGGLDVRLYCCSSDMIEAVESGELAIAYNVLGSYAVNRKDAGNFTIILPSDFTTVMLRTVLIPTEAPSPRLAQVFVDHMLEQSFTEEENMLAGPALLPVTSEASLHRIRLGPGLLVFLDQLKKRSFLVEWENAIFQK